MKVRLALFVAALQVIVLAFMAGQREWISHTGTPLTLRTAPIDPNDPMRGAYVRLDYEISMVPAAQCLGEVLQWTKATTDYRAQQHLRDRVVYAALSINPYGIAELVTLGDIPPEHGPFLRGRVQTVDTTGVTVRYGIEALFMEKSAAQKMEAMTFNEKVGAPIDAHIKVGRSGTAVLQHTTWEPLGLTLELDRPPRRQAQDQTQPWRPAPITGVTVTLHNYGDQDLAVVDLPGALSFRLAPNTRVMGGSYAWAGEKVTDTPAPGAADIIVLRPGTKHSVHLDLTQPRWWVIDTHKPGSAPFPMQQLTEGRSASFRIEYAPPGADAVRGLPHAELIRHHPLRSRGFNSSQLVD